jgi:cytochrome bd-type quinol oxidase subunit 2
VSVGTIFTAGFAMLPFLIPSSDIAHHSLTVWDASSSEQVLRITLTVATALVPLALAGVAWGLVALRKRGTLQTLSAQTEARANRALIASVQITRRTPN